MYRGGATEAVVCLFITVLRDFVSPYGMGTYTLVCNEIHDCDGDSSGFKLIRKQDGNSSKCRGEINLRETINDRTTGDYTLEMLTKDQWRALVSENFTEGCEGILETLPELFPLLQQPATCPLVNGTYSLQGDYLTGSTLSRVPKLPFGRFRLVVRIFDFCDTVVRGCISFDINIVPT